MARFLAVITCLYLCLSASVSQASKISNPALSIRAFEESSTDAYSIIESLLKARNFYENENFEEAAQAFSILLKYDPALEEAVIGLAKSYMALGQFNSAENVLTASKTQSDEKYILLALISAKTQTSPEAGKDLRHAIILYDDSRLWNALGQKLSRERDIVGAKNAFTKAELRGQNPGIYENNLAMLAFRQGDMDTALRHMKQSLKQAPQNVKFDDNYRILLLFKGDYINALKEISLNRADTLLLDAAIIASWREEHQLTNLFLKTAQSISTVHNPKHQALIASLKAQ